MAVLTLQARVLTTADPAMWDGYLARLPGADIYHTAAYHRAHEANGDGAALAFVAEDGENVLFHPFMLSDIPGTSYRDIETVYGYSGTLCTKPWVWFAGVADVRFAEWCREQRVVAEFIRFNPLTRNEMVFVGPPSVSTDSELLHASGSGPGSFWRCDPDRETVVVDLAGTPDDLWTRYPSVQRNMLRKAIIRGLSARDEPPESALPVFRPLYEATMDRRGAGAYYHFGGPYYRTLARELGERLRVFVARDHYDGARPVGAALFLRYGDRLHYHLAGSNPAGRERAAANLILHEAALWGQRNGCRWLHLGGGLSPDPADPLLRFKASLSRERCTFYTGRRIHDRVAYRALCDDWRARHPGEAGNYFLLWRKP